jgi:hypothetical protein
MRTLKQGEAKPLTMVVTDEFGAYVDISAASLFLGVKRTKEQVGYSISKDDGDFDKVNAETPDGLKGAENGAVSVFLDENDTNIPPGAYFCELKVTWSGAPQNIERTEDFFLTIRKSVIPPA